MRLNKENYELLMFDLLEGNLSKADELSIIKQIEENEFFFKEWKLFKSTVLVSDEEIVYANKETLLKDEKATAVVSIRRIWLSVAASICLLAVVYVFWPNSPTKEVVNTPVDILEDKTIDTAGSPILEVPEDFVLEADNTNEKSFTPSTTGEQRRQNNKRTEVQPMAKVPLEVKGAENIIEKIDDSPLPQTDEIPQVVAKEIKEPRKTNEENPEKEKIDDLEPKSPEIIAQNETPQSPEKLRLTEIAKDFVTKNKPSRIKEKANEIIALISNPKVRFRPDFKSKRPSLEIELETEGYVAIASIQPFKNRNN